MKKFFYLAMAVCTLGFVACNDDDNNDDGDTTTEVKVSSVTGTTTGITTVKAVTYAAVASGGATNPEDQGATNGIVLATTEFKDGGFTIQLPATVTNHLLSIADLVTGGFGLPEELLEGITISNANAKVVNVDFQGFKDDVYENSFECGKSDTDVLYFFFTEACDVTGDVNVEAITLTFNVKATKGWNRVAVVYGETGVTVTTTIPSGTGWSFDGGEAEE